MLLDREGQTQRISREEGLAFCFQPQLLIEMQILIFPTTVCSRISSLILANRKNNPQLERKLQKNKGK